MWAGVCVCVCVSHPWQDLMIIHAGIKCVCQNSTYNKDARRQLEVLRPAHTQPRVRGRPSLHANTVNNQATVKVRGVTLCMYSNYICSEELKVFKLTSRWELPLMGITGKAVTSHQEHILTMEGSAPHKCEYRARFFLFF